MPIYKMNGKKDGLQKYRVRINYIDKAGKPRQLDRVAYGAQAAKELERQLMSNSEETTIAKISLNDLYKEYLCSKKGEVRETTLDKKKQMIGKFVLPSLGNTKVDKLSASVLQKWKNELSEAKNKKGSLYSLTYKNNIYKAFSALLNYAVKMEYIKENPLHNVGSFRDVNITQKKKMDYYTADEFKRYICVAKAQAESDEKKGTIIGWGFYVFFMIAFYTGMRKGEINALTWNDIDNDIIHIQRSIAQKLKGGDRETAPKNASSVRDLQIPIPLKTALEDHHNRCKVIEGFTDEWRVCGGIRCLRDTTIDKRNRAYADAAGLKHIRIHDFRHSHASVLINEGINIMEIARRLGHSDVEVTWNTYAHLYPREEDRALKILNEIV